MDPLLEQARDIVSRELEGNPNVQFIGIEMRNNNPVDLVVMIGLYKEDLDMPAIIAGEPVYYEVRKPFEAFLK